MRIGALGEAWPEHVLRRVFFSPAVGVVGVYVAEHTLTATLNEILVAADDAISVAGALQEE